MATYIGFYQANEEFFRANAERARAGEPPDLTLRDKVVELRDKLPASLTLIGSWGVSKVGAVNRERPNVWICETDNAADLQFVSNYYQGFLEFEWVPATSVGVSASEARTNMDAAEQNR